MENLKNILVGGLTLAVIGAVLYFMSVIPALFELVVHIILGAIAVATTWYFGAVIRGR